MRFCGGRVFFRSNMEVSYERFKLRVAFGLAWPGSSTCACRLFSWLPGGHAESFLQLSDNT